MANNGRQHDFGHWGNLAGRSPIENPELGWGGRPPPVNIEGALNRGDQFAHRDVEVPYRYRGQPSFDSPITNEKIWSRLLGMGLLIELFVSSWLGLTCIVSKTHGLEMARLPNMLDKDYYMKKRRKGQKRLRVGP